LPETLGFSEDGETRLE